MKQYLILLVISILSIQIGLAQVSVDDSTRFEHYVDRILATSDSANFYVQEAEKLTSTPYRQVRLNRVIARYLYRQRQSDSAVVVINRNMGLPMEGLGSHHLLEIAKSYIVLNDVHSRRNEHQTALKFIDQAIAIMEKHGLDKRTLSQSYSNRGYSEWLSSNFNEAERAWKRSLDLAIESDHREQQIANYYNLSLVYTKQLKLSLAKEQYKYLLSVTQDNSEQRLGLRVLSHNGLGGVYNEQQETDSALYYFKKGLELVNTNQEHPFLKGRVVSYRSIFVKNMANAYSKAEDYENSIASYREALEISESIHGKDDTQNIRILTGLARSLRKVELYRESEKQLFRALDISKANDLDIVRTYTKLGDLYRAEKKWNLAMSYYDSALNHEKMTDIQGLGLYDYSSPYKLSALVGNIISEEGKESTDMAVMDSLYGQFMDVVKYVYNQTDKSAAFPPIQEAMEALYKSYSNHPDFDKNETYLTKLWEISEMTKAIKLRNQLKLEYSLNYSVPDEVLSRQKELRDSINLVMAKIQPGEFDSTLFFLNRKYNQFLKQLEEQHPRYYALKNTIEVPALSGVQKRLSDGEVLLNFFEGMKAIYFLKITTDVIERSHAPKRELEQNINSFSKAIFNLDEPSILSSSEKIKRALKITSSDLKQVKKLRVVPDGIIWNLNFSALAEEANDKVTYLGNETMISFEYFTNTDRPKALTSENEVLAFSYNEESDALIVSERTVLRNLEASLPGTAKEVVSISSLWDGDYLFAQQASETAFKKDGGKFRIIHLAVHGYQDPHQPQNSYLKFSSSDSLNDGRLHVYEIYNLDLNAELAVLSACHSGQGTVVAGEGMMSLGRSFAYAGVKSLLISRWEVSDYSAPHLMKYFYQGLKKGMRKSEALRYAQQQYLENVADETTSTPFFWSSLYVLGDDSPITNPKRFKTWMFLLVGALLILGAVYLRKRTLSAK